MTLKNWKSNGWLKAHKTSEQEITNLIQIVERDLLDAKQEGVSADWRFGIAYNAALKLCTILLYSSGYRANRALAHYRTIQSLYLILGDRWQDDTDYLNSCRIKRNTVEYDYVGGASNADAEELIEFTKKLQFEVLKWLDKK